MPRSRTSARRWRCSTRSPTARRASQELLNLIKKMVQTLPMAKSFESISNQETYEITINGDKRRCSSYPGCSRTLRGTGGDLIVLEEAAYIDEAVFNEARFDETVFCHFAHT